MFRIILLFHVVGVLFQIRTHPSSSSSGGGGGIGYYKYYSWNGAYFASAHEQHHKTVKDVGIHNDKSKNTHFIDTIAKKEAAVQQFNDRLLRKKKRKGLLVPRKASLADVLFPGVAPEVYTANEAVFIITDLVQSKKTHVPFSFYDLPGCPGARQTAGLNFQRVRHRHARRNLGARLQGLELIPAPFPNLRMMDNTNNNSKGGCVKLCAPVSLASHQVRWLRKLVERHYRVHLALDQLPVLMRSTPNSNSHNNMAFRGYPVGFKAPPSYTGLAHDQFYLYNHLKFIITVRKLENNDEGDKQQQQKLDSAAEGYHITAFHVYPVSIDHAADGSTCTGTAKDKVENVPETYLALSTKDATASMDVTYSYEVEWVQGETEWADRWDVYLLGSPDDDIHVFAIVNSLMIVLFLTGAVATIMIRTLRRDILAYNNELAVDDDGGGVVMEESGWKLVHADVFRPPQTHPIFLAVLVGSGAQIGTAFFGTLLAALCQLLNPIRKGQTLTAVVVLYVMSGSVSGYVAARISQFCHGGKATRWQLTTLATATALPGFLVGTFSILNVFLTLAGAATAISFGLLLAIFALWVCVSAPLVLIGAYLAYRTAPIDSPVRTNHIARIIPVERVPWYSRPPLSFLVGGILPFGSVCIELFFIMSALWLHQFYYFMGFLLAVGCILAATCAQVGIVMDYLQLCSEDHRWWWKSFGNCASAGLYLFAYSLWFLVSRLDLVGVLPVVIYLTYMFMISLCFGLFCGSIGFLCAFWFNQKIYNALKTD